MLKSVKEQETEITYKCNLMLKLKKTISEDKIELYRIILVIRMKWKPTPNFTEMT